MSPTADWTTLTGAELGAEVVTLGKALWQDDAARRGRMLDAISRYEGKRLPGLDPSAYRNSGPLLTDDETAVRWNLVRSLVATATAEIAGGQLPKVQFVASNADWTTRRKGPKLDAFVSGLWGTRQEPYADIWEMGAFAFRDCAVCGLGAIKIWTDIDLGRVAHERVFPWELLTDPEDAKYGSPNNLWHLYSVPRRYLVSIFAESKEVIETARSAGSDDDAEIAALGTYLGAHRVVDSVRCYEWWLLPIGPEAPGKHVIAIDGGVLLEEEWTRDTFPLALIRWDREFQGWNGTSLIEEVAGIDDEMNDILGRISRTVRLTSIGVCWVRDDCDVSGDLITNEDAAVLKYSGGTLPNYQSPAPFGQEHIAYLDLMKRAGYEMTGISQMSATAQKQEGIESGTAIRMVADLQSKRFAIVWKAYQSLYIEIARHDIASVRELANDDSEFAVKWPGSGFLRSIKWSSVDLPDDMFVIQLASAPSIKGTPADRMSGATELFAAGQLSADALMAVRTSLDLPGELERASRQRNVVEGYIERWLDATPDELAALAAGDVEGSNNLYRPPFPLMRLEDALLQVVDGYMQAELDEAPDEIKDLFLRWIAQADAEILKRKARLASIQQPSPLPPPGVGMPPPPPGGPLA